MLRLLQKPSDLYGAQKVDSMSLLVAKTFCCLLLNWKLMLKELFKVNHGVGGVMVSLDTQVPHGFLRLRQGFDNTITSSDSRATNENDMVP